MNETGADVRPASVAQMNGGWRSDHPAGVGAACQDERVTDRLMLLDSASLYFRAFYGVPDTVRAPDGTPVNAVRGFLDIITRLVTTYHPTHLVACWDDDWRPPRRRGASCRWG